jgi:hypothetical protein
MGSVKFSPLQNLFHCRGKYFTPPQPGRINITKLLGTYSGTIGQCAGLLLFCTFTDSMLNATMDIFARDARAMAKMREVLC